MENQSTVVALSSTEPKGKRRRRSAKPSGPQTAPVTQPAAPAPQPTPEPKKESGPAWGNEPEKERLEVANAALKAALARYQSLGVKLMTLNESGATWIRFIGAKFVAPGTENVDLMVMNEEKPTQANK